MKQVKRTFVRLANGKLPREFEDHVWDEELSAYVLETEDGNKSIAFPIVDKSDQLVAELNGLIESFQAFMINFYQTSGTIMKQLTTLNVKPGDMSDLGFLFRQLESHLDDLRKEAKARKEVIGKNLARELVLSSVSNSDDSVGKIYGRLSTASPDVEFVTSPPSFSSNNEVYKEFLTSLGVREETIETGVLDIHFKRFNEWIKNRVQAGLPVPSGIKVSAPNFKCEFRKR